MQAVVDVHIECVNKSLPHLQQMEYYFSVSDVLYCIKVYVAFLDVLWNDTLLSVVDAVSVA